MMIMISSGWFDYNQKANGDVTHYDTIIAIIVRFKIFLLCTYAVHRISFNTLS